MPRYFSGAAHEMGQVASLPHANFAALCAEVVAKPVPLSFTRATYLALPKKDKTADIDQDRAKRVRYLTPAAFRASPSQRNYESAKECNLVFLDIDDGREATRLLTQGWDLLGDLGFVVWHTATSTPAKPRLRLMVNADGIPVARYRAAAQTIAGMLGIADPTTESLVAVQIMYLPVTFKGDPASPIVASNAEGDPFLPSDIVTDSEDTQNADTPATGDVADLDFLRAPMEGITLPDAADALNHIDPDVPMQKWIEIAAGLKHQFGDAAYSLWDTWSAKGKKYVDSDETQYRWGTLKANTPNRAPITIRSVFKFAADAGWKNEALSRRARNDLAAWIRNSARSSEELLDTGAKRIAKIAPMLGPLERKALMSTLRETLAERDMVVTLPDIRKEVHRLETEAIRQAGFPPWTKGVCFVTAKNIFYRYATDRQMTPEVVDLIYATTTEGDMKATRPRDYLVQIAGIPQVENLRYDPRQADKRFFTDRGVPYVNTYRPSYAKPNPDTAEEAGRMFRHHLQKLILEEEYRTILIDYLAFLVQRPGVKIRWAPLIQSAKGAGKTLIAVVMAAVLGKSNVCKLAGSDVLNRQYNEWAYGYQLVVMEEVRVVGHNRHDVMDKLKPCITDDEISLNCKFDALRTVPNIANYLMFTNHQDALAVQDDERRYFVLRSPLQRKEDVVKLGGDAYFQKIYASVRDNPGGLRAWFEQWRISVDFDPNGRAPETPYLREMADNASTPLAAAIRSAIEDEPHALVRRDLLSSAALRAHVSELPGIPEYSEQLLSSVLREMGWVRWGRVMLDGSRHNLWTNGLNHPDPALVAQQRYELL